MPNSEPTNVRTSPKAISTELSITPVGGTQKPAMSKPTPTAVRTAADASCKIFSLFFFVFILRKLKKCLSLCCPRSESITWSLNTVDFLQGLIVLNAVYLVGGIGILTPPDFGTR